MAYSNNSRYTMTFPAMYGNTNDKISVIKALRDLFNLGLKEAKDAAESSTPVTFNLGYNRISLTYATQVAADAHIDDMFRVLRTNGVIVGGSVQILLNELRDLASKALAQHEDDLANEILQLVLAEKMRQQND